MEPKVKGKFVTSSKLKKFQNPFCKKKMEMINNKNDVEPFHDRELERP